MNFKCTLVGALSLLAVVGCKPRNFNKQKSSAKSVANVGYPGENGFRFDPADTSCDGYPRLHIESMPGTCVGMVYSTNNESFQPRVILEIPGHPGEFLVTDFAGWSTTDGKIWLMKTSGSKNSVEMMPLLTGLSVPHQIVVGPESWIYFSTDSAIYRFKPSDIYSGAEPKLTPIVSDMPPMYRGTTKNSMHPLKHFAFDKAGNLYVNIGAYTDHCSPFVGKECHEADYAVGGGTSANIKDQGGLIRRYNYKGSVAAGWESDYKVIAQGLRNSMGLLFAPNGDLLQAENGRDFTDSARPYEEINRIAKAHLDGSTVKHYGWPYCYDFNRKSEEWASFGFSCDPTVNASYQPPQAFLPPHGAPLGMTYYTGNKVPGLNGKLLVPVHGYRTAGHRLLSYTVDANGLPARTGKGKFWVDDEGGGTQSIAQEYTETPSTAAPTEVISGWYGAPKYRPKGAPVAVAQGADEALWITDDKNHAILRLSSFNGTPHAAAPRPYMSKAYSDVIKESPDFKSRYNQLVKGVLKSPQCADCHDNYINSADTNNDGFKELRYILGMGTWVQPGKLDTSTLYTKMYPVNKATMPPIDKPFLSPAAAGVAADDVKNFILAMPTPEKIWTAKTGLVADLRGNKPGVADISCGSLNEGSFVLAKGDGMMRSAMFKEITVAGGSALVTNTACAGMTSYWIKADELQPLLPQ